MTVAYVDTSCLVAVAFGERGGTALSRRLSGFGTLLASNLLEAELRAVFAREEVEFAPSMLARIEWVLPERPLSPELAAALAGGRLRGADLWHIATALYLACGSTGDVAFLTLDKRQRAVAERLGFAV